MAKMAKWRRDTVEFKRQVVEREFGYFQKCLAPGQGGSHLRTAVGAGMKI